DAAGDALDGADDVVAAAVAEREDEAHARVGGGHLARGLEFAADGGREVVEGADGEQSDVVLHELGAFLDGETFEQAHEGGGFALGALPVFTGEGVEGEGVEAE